jgi:hypothetical protein
VDALVQPDAATRGQKEEGLGDGERDLLNKDFTDLIYLTDAFFPPPSIFQSPALTNKKSPLVHMVENYVNR